MIIFKVHGQTLLKICSTLLIMCSFENEHDEQCVFVKIVQTVSNTIICKENNVGAFWTPILVHLTRDCKRTRNSKEKS